MKLFCCLLAVVFCLSGCVTMGSSAKEDEIARVRSATGAEMSSLRDELREIKGRLDNLEYTTNQASRAQDQQSKELNASLKDFRKTIGDDINKSVSGIENRLRSVETAQTQLRDRVGIITDEVSKENKELRKQIEAIRASHVSRASGTSHDGGYYVVADGDTLSKISQMFGIPVKSILDANDISDPNTIRKGQRLIIPQR